MGDKIMKKIIILLLILPLISCEDFLEEIPRDRLTEVGFYGNANDARAAVDAIYNPLRTLFRTQYMWMVDVQADYAHGRGSLQPVSSYLGFDPINVTRAQGNWGFLYRSIRNANIAIERIPQIDMPEANKTALVAEARFLRALAYHHLARNFGAVPLYIETVNEDTERKPVGEVYQAIISDLQFGETNLPEFTTHFGRPTRWSAKALLAEVYLTVEEWQLAMEKSLEVINSGNYALVEVTVANDFNNVFGPNASGSVEEIFYIKYNHEDGWSYPMNLLWETTEWGTFGNYIIYSTPGPFHNNWDDDDLRKEWNVFTEYINRHTGELETLPASTPILCRKYRDPNAPTREGFANDFPRLRFADVLLIYAESAALANNSVTPLALESLNKIKRRAYGFPYNSPSPVDFSTEGWTVNSFRETVIQERAYELYMEAKRWPDLKRLGPTRLKEIILENTGLAVQDVALLWPIPPGEINTNPQINPEDQNPGY
jgi:starch-binding outer membrane protein, SusD/RagB family